MADTQKIFSTITFPAQRVSKAEKDKPEWYANCIDYIIDAGLACNDRTETETMINLVHGEIPNDLYKKTLNPYNSNKEKYQRFPATLRNYDITTGLIRRYVSEYYKGVHEFTVGADNPEIIINKNAKLKKQVLELAQQQFVAMMQQKMAEAQQQALQNGQNPEEIDPKELMPDMEEFIKNFEENYIDEETIQGQQVYEFIRNHTDDLVIYLQAISDYVTYGECYTYSDVRGDTIFKEAVPLIYAYPIPNGKMFVEDHDMFARKIKMSYQQILDNFGDNLDDKDLLFLETYYGKSGIGHGQSAVMLSYNQYFEKYPAVCEKFTDAERKFFKNNPVMVSDINTNLYDVWHVVWRGDAKRGILTYINEMGFEDQKTVDEDFKFNPEEGHINIEWYYVPQVYEGYRIGLRTTAIYPIKYRPISYNRKGKLPYNGLMEILPGLGKFSIVNTVSPYQILRNILFYHREMVIAKNKMLILLMPQSLIESNAEDRLYKMAADGVLLYDDEEDTTSVKAQQIRMLNASLGNYISEITQLAESIKLEAREAVDMNEQRFGQINQSAGKAVTDEAVARSSMGSIVIYAMFDEFRRRDYERDIDYAKLAYIEGLEKGYTDLSGHKQYISLDVDKFIGSDYGVTVRNNEKERERIQQLKQWAFSAAQNGDLDMAAEAILNDNVPAIKAGINKFMEIKRQHENELKQADQQIEQMKEQFELTKIQAQGEEDRKTEELKAYLAMQQSYIDLDVSQFQNPFNRDQAEAQLKQTVENNKAEIERQKLSIEQQKLQADLYNAAADRQVKREDIANQLKIARTNKNKYDK
uniref:Portal protein n=1 Tax=Geladintestivirus 1 TaxID=3233133 RepID=A0AAU8MHA7_9CAUD